MREIKRILEIQKTEGYKICCVFNNGESRVLDFESLFKAWKVTPNDPEYLLSESLTEFQKVELIEGTLRWKNIEIESADENGNRVIYAFEIDPIVLYEKSTPIDRGLIH